MALQRQSLYGWIKIVYKDSATWLWQRELAMEAANNKCEDCGEEAKHVHHLDGKRDNHELDNLKALCIKCHRGYHKGKQITHVYGDEINLVTKSLGKIPEEVWTKFKVKCIEERVHHGKGFENKRRA